MVLKVGDIGRGTSVVVGREAADRGFRDGDQGIAGRPDGGARVGCRWDGHGDVCGNHRTMDQGLTARVWTHAIRRKRGQTSIGGTGVVWQLLRRRGVSQATRVAQPGWCCADLEGQTRGSRCARGMSPVVGTGLVRHHWPEEGVADGWTAPRFPKTNRGQERLGDGRTWSERRG